MIIQIGLDMIMEYYHFTLYNCNFAPKNLMVPVKEFMTARKDDIKIIEANNTNTKPEYDVVVDIMWNKVKKGSWVQANTEITRIYNHLLKYADDLHHEYRFYENDDGTFGDKMNLYYIKESDNLWWTEDVVTINLEYRDIYDIGEINRMAVNKGIKIVKSYLFSEKYDDSPIEK